MSELDSLLRTESARFGLEALRIAGVVVTAPLAWQAAPLRVRGGLVLLLAFAVHAKTSAALGGRSIEELAFGAGSEFVLGLAIGFIVRLFVSIAEMAADHIAPMMGIGAAQLFDPQTKSMQNVLGTVFRHFAVLLALIAGLHRVLLAGVLYSFEVVPVASLAKPSLATPVMLAMTSEALLSGVRVAIPFVAILFVAQVALAFISRAAPAMQIFSIGFAVTMATGSLVLLLALPDVGLELLSEVSRTGGKIETLLRAVQGAN